MKNVLRIACIVSALFIAGCREEAPRKPNRFTTSNVQYIDGLRAVYKVAVITDNETGFEYIITSEGGITPLVRK